MTTNPLHYQKKVRRMGTLLAIVSWFGLAVCVLGFIFLMIFNVVWGEYIREFGEFPLGVDDLPAGISAEMTVAELIQTDNEFLQANMGLFSIHLALAFVFYAFVAIIFLRIAFAWRRSEPFTNTTTGGLRWLGILLLAQSVFGFIYSSFATESLSWILDNSALYDVALESFIGSYGHNLEFGILLVALSWVLEYGSKMKEEQELTV